MDITNAFSLLLQQEGTTLTKVSGDKGGLTKYGITEKEYPELDIANLTSDQARVIYQRDYWQAAKCSQLKEDLQYMHFSCAVNCGVGSANKILQRAAGVTPDGIIGAQTLQAAQNLSIQDYAIEWAAHYRAIVEHDPTQQKFLKGWLNRIDFCLKLFTPHT